MKVLYFQCRNTDLGTWTIECPSTLSFLITRLCGGGQHLQAHTTIFDTTEHNYYCHLAVQCSALSRFLKNISLRLRDDIWCFKYDEFQLSSLGFLVKSNIWLQYATDLYRLHFRWRFIYWFRISTFTYCTWSTYPSQSFFSSLFSLFHLLKCLQDGIHFTFFSCLKMQTFID